MYVEHETDVRTAPSVSVLVNEKVERKAASFGFLRSATRPLL